MYWFQRLAERTGANDFFEDFAALVAAECYASRPMDSLKGTSETTQTGITSTRLLNTLSTIIAPCLLTDDSQQNNSLGYKYCLGEKE